MKQTSLEIGDISVDVTFKKIKNLNLRVYPPFGVVRISAPRRMSINTIRDFVVSRQDWIRKKQHIVRSLPKALPKRYVENETHFVWGESCSLKIVEEAAAPQVNKEGNVLLLQIRPNTDQERRQSIIEAWYRHQMKSLLPAMIKEWEAVMDVHVDRFFVRKMKTRWGSCSYTKGTIRLNSELAKKPVECLEYVLVHELVHFLEPSHNARFKGLMDHFMPNWRDHQETLNHFPMEHREGTH